MLCLCSRLRRASSNLTPIDGQFMRGLIAQVSVHTQNYSPPHQSILFISFPTMWKYATWDLKHKIMLENYCARAGQLAQSSFWKVLSFLICQHEESNDSPSKILWASSLLHWLRFSVCLFGCLFVCCIKFTHHSSVGVGSIRVDQVAHSKGAGKARYWKYIRIIGMANIFINISFSYI